MGKIDRRLLCLVAWCLGAIPASADDVQVNTYTTGLQAQASVAVTDDGHAVVVWSSEDSATQEFGFSIQGQRYAPDGTPAGDQFQVSTSYIYNQFAPEVAIDSDGDFTVVWTTDGQAPGVRAQRFASDGATLGAEFKVNTYNAGYQIFASIAAAPAGGFVVVWQSGGSEGTDSSSTSIQGRLYAEDGSPLTPQFQVNTLTTSAQIEPGIALAPDGDFVVVWENYGATGTQDPRIHGQRFTSDGTPAGDEFQVATSATGSVTQLRPVAAMDAEGDFVVVWEHNNSEIDEVWAQRFASDGSPLTQDFLVTAVDSNAPRPVVASNAGGEFVIVWDREIEERTVIEGRLYAADGSENSDTFQINTNPIGSHSSPSVSANSAGEFLVAWRGFETGGNDPDDSVEKSEFFFLSGLIFADGFESGDTSAWSD